MKLFLFFLKLFNLNNWKLKIDSTYSCFDDWLLVQSATAVELFFIQLVSAQVQKGEFQPDSGKDSLLWTWAETNRKKKHSWCARADGQIIIKQ